MWDAQLGAFAPYFTVAALDARGYHDSDDPPGELRFGDFADDVARVLDSFGVERAHLMGASMGGRIALHFWKRCAERVASLELVNTSAGSHEQSSPERIEEFLRMRRQPLLDGKTPADIAPEIARTLLAPGSSAAVLERTVGMLANLRKASYLQTLETVTRFMDFPAFESIQLPVLVLVGEHDRIATPQYAAHMARRFPQAQLRVLPGVGHLSNMEDPVTFNAALLEFLLPLRERASVPRKIPE